MAIDHTGATSPWWMTPVAVSGFVAVSIAQVTNMILARSNAGAVPPFSLAFFRWSIIAIGLAPFVAQELRSHRRQLLSQCWPTIAAGFTGMFLCGGPVYIAGVTTTAINIALIMALSPIVVLVVSSLIGLERVGVLQVFGVAVALIGALVVISGGRPMALFAIETARGDLFVLIAMLGWSAYTLLQSRAIPELPFVARVSVFAAIGAVLSLPFAIPEAISEPARVFSLHALGIYLFAGIVPGILAYAGFAYLDGRFGSVRTSLVLYVGPIASALLSFLVLGEPPHTIQIVGGALILVGVWSSLKKQKRDLKRAT